jgi:hypothetical protein
MPTPLFCTTEGSRIIGFYSQHFLLSLSWLLGLIDHILKISWELQVIKIVCHDHEMILIGSIFTEGYCLSAFNWELKNIYWICHYHQQNKSVGIFQAGIIFWSVIFICKIINNFFYQ